MYEFGRLTAQNVEHRNQIMADQLLASKVQMVLSLRFIPVFAMTFALALLAQAQERKPILAGRITDADSGAPIEGATITLEPPIVIGRLDFQTATTDRNGNYRFEKVVGGNYYIHVSADGFVSQDYKTEAAPRGAFLSLDSSKNIQGVDIQLMPEAVIRGSVIDSAGKPVTGILVSAIRQEKATKGPTSHLGLRGPDGYLILATAATDAEGQFALKGLSADTYIIRAKEYGVLLKGPGDSILVHTDDPADGASPHRGVWYRETWYGGTPSSEGAVPIAVKMRDDRNGVQIAVPREMRYRVVIWPSGPVGDRVPDMYSYDLGNFRSQHLMKQDDGSYAIPGLLPGHYTVVITALSGGSYLGQGEGSFDVSDSDVTIRVNCVVPTRSEELF
jgi:protocatechuate 3,4-dioxygenase beta subunit